MGDYGTDGHVGIRVLVPSSGEMLLRNDDADLTVAFKVREQCNSCEFEFEPESVRQENGDRVPNRPHV